MEELERIEVEEAARKANRASAPSSSEAVKLSTKNLIDPGFIREWEA